MNHTEPELCINVLTLQNKVGRFDHMMSLSACFSYLQVKQRWPRLVQTLGISEDQVP